MSKGNKTSSIEIPCSIFDIQNSGDCLTPDTFYLAEDIQAIYPAAKFQQQCAESFVRYPAQMSF